MSEPPADPKSDPPAPDPKSSKDKGKGLDKFIDKDKPVRDGVIKVDAVTDGSTEDVDYKEEIEKLQKEQYKMKRQQVLSDLSAINPEVAEKYKSSKLSELETALKVAKVVTPKFPVNRDAPVVETPQLKGHLNRRTMKWE